MEKNKLTLDETNWKSSDHYMFNAKNSNLEWAWEFLRRNENYKYDFHRYANNLPFEEYQIDIVKDINFDNRVVVFKKGYSDRLYKVIAKKYRVFMGSVLLDPNLPLSETDYFGGEYGVLCWQSYVETPNDAAIHAPLHPKSECEFNVQFRLDRPFKYQIEQCERLLSNARKQFSIKERRAQIRESTIGSYINYLRVYDAKNVGACGEEIAATVFESIYNNDAHDDPIGTAIRKVSDSYKQAKRMIGRDYLKLILD